MTEDAAVKTYCENEVVRLSCPRHNQLIVITAGKYGRMREGRCMTSTYGVVGCSIDVVHLLDSRCSGRRRCDVTVASLVDEQHQPCPLDFRSYLELSHRCVTGDVSSHYHILLLLMLGELGPSDVVYRRQSDWAQTTGPHFSR